MDVHATGEVSHAIVVDDEVLKRLWSHAESFAGIPTVTVSCVDNIERKFGSIQDLITYENAKRAEIQAIEIYARDPESSRSITVTLGRRWGSRANLSMRGEEYDVSVTRAKILDTFAGMRPWYSPVATLDLWIFWAIALCTLMVLLSTMAPSKSLVHDGRTAAEALRIIAASLIMLAPIPIAIWLVSKLRSTCFPLVSMAIGQGLRRYQVIEQVRWAVLVAFVVGLVGSAIYGAIGGT